MPFQGAPSFSYHSGGVPMHHQEAFITTSPHRSQNQIWVSQSIMKEPSSNNSKSFQSPQQGKQESLWIENFTCLSTDTKTFYNFMKNLIKPKLRNKKYVAGGKTLSGA